MIDAQSPPVTVFLQKMAGFCDMDTKALDDVARVCKMQLFGLNQHLIRKGEAGTHLYLIVEGQVQVQFQDDTGKLCMTSTLGPGDVVGEMSLLTSELRRNDVIACTPVSALAMGAKQIDRLMHQYPSMANFLTSILVKRIQSVAGFRQIGKYQLLGELGKGSTATVYEGVHQQLKRPVAIKMLNHALVYDDLFLQRFQAESRTIARLQHPNIIQVYDTERSHGTFFIIMEKLSGNDLKRHLKDRGKFSPAAVVPILLQVAGALEYAHQNDVIHRDVKLANCIMTETGHIKLMDFGLSQSSDSLNPATLEGSPDYLAPELILGNHPDGRSDVYALGVMAFTLLVGKTPFNAKSVRQVLYNHIEMPVPDLKSLIPDITEELLEFIQGALVKDPNQRLTHWPTIVSLLERRKHSQHAMPVVQTYENYSYSYITLSCPTDSTPLLLETLERLSPTIDGLTWSSPTQPNSLPIGSGKVKT